MKVCFLGTSHAALTLRKAADWKGFFLTDSLGDADIIFVSEDTPLDDEGRRFMGQIDRRVKLAASYQSPVILTSQVEPGYCRSKGCANLIHQVDTLRISDATERARHPEQFIIGTPTGEEELPACYQKFLNAWGVPEDRILRMRYEEAEFAKIAFNAMLVAQVECTNRLAKAAARCGADWRAVKQALANDKRIGPHAYLEPGSWERSLHLRRDMLTLKKIEER